MSNVEPAPKRKRSATKRAPAAKAAAKKASAMSDAHKQALAAGREQGRAVRRYLDALDSHRPKRGRKRTAESIEARLAMIEQQIPAADGLTRVHLAQERIDLLSELQGMGGESVDMSELEDAFVNTAAEYGSRKGISYAAWRAAGVDAAVLRRAGIARTRN